MSAARIELAWNATGAHALDMAAPFKVTARAERASVSLGKSTLWAALRIAASGPGLDAQRAPLAIALVIDASTSMRGDPIAHALLSCRLLAGVLGPDDRLAIVTFSSRAEVLCGLTATDDAGRAQIAASLRRVKASRGTNLYGGLTAAAGLLTTAPDGLRRTIVVLSDGQPNMEITSPDELAAYVRTLRPMSVSSLGLGLHHDEDVLHAIAMAGSGRYAYLPDPLVARIDLARAALAHGSIVADQLELKLKLSDGVELIRLLPASQLRHGSSGVATAIGDVFVDEDRMLASELALDVGARATGELARVAVTGRAADGNTYDVELALAVDVHAGPHAIDRDAQRDVLLVRAEAARADARGHADRGALTVAVALLHDIVDHINSSDAFVENDGSPLAEIREQLLDEILGYKGAGSGVSRAHQRKAAFDHYSGPTARPTAGYQGESAPGVLVRIGGPHAGERYQLATETMIGRSRDNDMVVSDDALSRRHARIVYLDGTFMLCDMGSRTGCRVNGESIHVAELADGDLVSFGGVEFRFERQV
jgi:Ca-activated chloride channel family protein